MKAITHIIIVMFSCPALFGALSDDTQQQTGPASLFDLSYHAVLQSPETTAQLDNLERTAAAELIYEAILKRGPLGPRFILHPPDRATVSPPSMFEGTTAYAYSHDGTHLAATNAFGQLNIWHTHTGKRIHSIDGYKDTQALAFTDNDHVIATISHHGVIKFTNAQTGKLMLTSNVVDKRATGRILATLSPDARMVALFRDNEIKLLNIATKKTIGTLADPASFIHKFELEIRRILGYSHAMLYEYTALMRFSPDSSKLAITGQTNIGGGIWNTQTGAIIRRLPTSTPWPADTLNPLSPGLAFSGNSQLLALLPPQELVGKNIAMVTTYNATAPQIIKLPKGIAQVKALALNADGSLLAGHFKLEDPREKRFIAIMNTRTQEFVHFPFALYDYCDWLIFSPDGSQLAALSRSSPAIALWDLNVPARIAALTSEEINLLVDARLAWNNNESYPIDASNAAFRSIIAKLPYMKSSLLFTLHGTSEQPSSSTDLAHTLPDDFDY
jgi:WD40 repeat protein